MSTLRPSLPLAAALLALLTLPGCASRRLAREEARALAAADAEVLRGCYHDCLRPARETYARAAAGKRAPIVAQRLFETELLLALREKELALDWDASLARARAAAARLPAALAPARVLALADVVMPDPDGVPSRARGEQRRRNVPMLPKLDAELAWLAGSGYAPAVRDYLTLAVECSNGRRSAARARVDSAAATHPMLVRYRSSFCARVDTVALRRLQEEEPRFAEAAYYRAQALTAGAAESGGDEPRALFEQASTRFPDAPGLAFAHGWLEMLAGDCETAVARFDVTVARQPAHERAWLQRTVCLSQQRRDSAAIPSATRVIEHGAPSQPDGHYWRALSHLRLGALSDARRDADSAKARARPDNVLTLAGVIEHDQGDLGVAEADLRAALAGPSAASNCTAASYLGRVLSRTSRWAEAAHGFDQAMGCFDLKVAQIRQRMERLAASDAPPAYVAARMARLAADSTEQRRSYHTSAFNAAGMYARAGDVARARVLLAVAEQEPERAEAVAKLRAALDALLAARRARTGGARR
jgi:tetratricopeptide (TPR) repeat protein